MSFPSRRLTAVCLVAAGLVTMAGMLATPWESESTTASYISAYVGHETQGQVAAVLLHFGYLLFLPAVFGLIAMLSEHGGRLRAIGGVLGVIGWATLPGMLVVDFYAIALVQELPLDQAVAIEEKASGMAGAAIIAMTGALPAFLGLFLLLISAARARMVPVAVPVVLLVGVVVGFAAPGLPMIIGSVLLLAACVLAARSIAGRPARPVVAGLNPVPATA